MQHNESGGMVKLDSGGEHVDGPNSPPTTEDSLALIFAERHAKKYQYVHEWRQWLHWTGTYWEKDRTRDVFNMARDICREAANLAKRPTDKQRLASAKTVAAVATLANADRSIAATSDDWDNTPDLLNTPGGIVDLPTGRMMPHDSDMKLTKITAAAPGGGCPLWLEFLATIADGDESLIVYLQRAAGYSLTGHTREHALFFGYGTGANGKGVFLNSLRRLMGDYAMVSAAETFMATRNEQHPTGLAALRGARLVIADETESGKQWAESRLKSLTGGDPIQARGMRQDPFEFEPTFKLFIVGNQKPSLSTVDEAFRRRLHFIPFNVTIPEAERDLELAGKLEPEWPGILAWAIEGARQWYEQGLNPPECVQAATAEYLEEQDSIAAWLASECETKDLPNYQRENIGDLFASWVGWCAKAGEQPGKQNWFSDQLKGKGFEKHRTATSRGFKGICLIRPNLADM